MARKFIPQYDPAARGMLIVETDSAWDRERIDRDLAAIGADGKPVTTRETHPLQAYWCGDTRFDIDACIPHHGDTIRPRDYLRDGETPEVFKIRRLHWTEHNEVVRIEDNRTRALRACRLGVSGADDSGIVLHSVNGLLTDASMENLHTADPDLAVRLGYAVQMYNLPITDAEKKR